MKWQCGLAFLLILTFALAAAEEEPAASQARTSNLMKWRQPAYDELLRSYKVDEKKANHYTKSQRYRVYDVPDDEKKFVNGTWHHPNYKRVQKKDVQASRKKANGTNYGIVSGLKLGGLVVAATAAEAVLNGVDDGDEETLKEQKSHARKPNHKARREQNR
jgi:hypothetical protein